MKAYKRGIVLKIPIIEFILSLISSWWAIVLFKTPDMFENIPQIYGFFDRFADEHYWAAIFLLAATVKILGIIVSNNSIRKIGLIMSAVLYGFIAYSYYIGNGWLSIGFGTFFALSVMALWGIREVEIRNG
jgi:hypothetical protein